MRLSLRAKIGGSFLVVVLITGLVGAVVGARLLTSLFINQAQEHVGLNLNTAWDIYSGKLKDIGTTLRFTVVRPSVMRAVAERDAGALAGILGQVRTEARLDVLGVADTKGKVVFRVNNAGEAGDELPRNGVVGQALRTGRLVTGSELLEEPELLREGGALGMQARVPLVPTEKAKPSERTIETRGLMLTAAAPILDGDGRLQAVLYAGVLLNRYFDIVDHIRDTVFRNQKYADKPAGTVTIFLKDVRVATNVMLPAGERAIGTRVSAEVCDSVLVRGEPWMKRAFVVDDWYITKYEPIRNIKGDIIGMLYVGLLEKKFDAVRHKTMWVFIGITTAGMALALLASSFLASSILSPIHHLASVARRLGAGDLTPRVEIRSRDEVGQLGTVFNRMAASLHERDERLREDTQQKLIQSEKLAAVGRLAAGVAHEINNPLTSILTYAHLLRKSCDQPAGHEDIQVIVQEATRCRDIVRRLLEFSRQEKPARVLADWNEVVEKSLSLTRNEAKVNGVEVSCDLTPGLPRLMLDPAKIQEAFINIALNAIDAMPEGGKLTASTGAADGRRVWARFQDTGHGIPPENLGKIFDPFFTTKDASKGTGLGLALAYGIVEEHGGRIYVSSEVGRGTVFDISIPVQADDRNRKGKP